MVVWGGGATTTWLLTCWRYTDQPAAVGERAACYAAAWGCSWKGEGLRGAAGFCWLLPWRGEEKGPAAVERDCA